MNTHEFRNVYEDPVRAAAYAMLDYPGTYHLAFRDLPRIIERHVSRGAGTALDFGCGAGRSTRFLRNLDFRTTGIDISAQMLAKANELDPGGDYRLVGNGDLSIIADASCDLALSAFTFDNVPTAEQKLRNFRELGRVLKPSGKLISIVSNAALYTHDWASFICTCFPENFVAKNGESVYTRMIDVPDARPVHDIRWDDDAYRETYAAAGLAVVAEYRPLGTADEPFEWVSESAIPPWVIWVLGRA